MADLLGGYVGNFLLDKVVGETKNVIYCKEYCHTLGELLETIRPLVRCAHEKLSTDSSAGTSGAVVKGPVPPPVPPPVPVKNWSEDLMRVFFCCLDIPDPVTKAPESSGPVKKWLEDLSGVLTEGEKAVSECNVSGLNALERNRLTRKLLDITKKITEICTTQAPLATLNVGIETLQGVAEMGQKIRKLDGTLDEIHQAVVQGNEAVAAGLAEIKVKLDVPAAAEADKLYTLRQEPKQTFGMDDRLEDLQGLLCGENVKWIGIYGTGGMGKTLLSTRACNTQVVQKHFQKHIYWLTVGRHPKVSELLQRLCGKLNVSTYSTEPDDEVKHKLFDALHGKKVLLVMDDVWNDGVPVLNTLDVTSDGTGSKILVTTREIQVLEEQSEQGTTTIKINGLSDSDSLKLFCQRAWGGVEKVPPGLDKELVKAVADECKGLPLALEVIARSQASQKLDEQWKRTLTKLKEAEKFNTALELQLYDRLQLSYDALESVDHRLQKCFLYFAAFPEDSDVHSEELVNLWAGENLIDTEEDPLEDGYYLLDELIGRSLIELRATRLPVEPLYNTRLQLTCRVHDVLRDFGLHLIQKGQVAPMDCLFSAGKGLQKFPDKWLTPTQPKTQQLGGRRPAASRATHISLSHNGLESLPTELDAPRLEVLLLANNRAGWDVGPLVISPGFLESFSSLKVLDLHETRLDSLPDTFGKLTNLMYLDLSKTGLHQVPVQLEKLTKLDFLSFRGCKEIQPWPFDISCLKMLTTLDTKGCRDIWKPQPGLQEHSDAPPSLPGSLDSLCYLTALRNLSMEGVQENLPSKFLFLVNLRCLQISFKNLKKVPATLHSRSEPQLCKLQYLSLEGCEDLSEVPPWVGSLSQLSHLYLRRCQTLKSLPNLDKLQHLLFLDLKDCYSLQELPPGFTTKGVPSLKKLVMDGCKELQKFSPIANGAFVQLEALSMNSCSFSELPQGFTSKEAFPALMRLDMQGCKELQKFPPIEDGAFGKLRSLRIDGCSNLLEIPDGFTLKGAFQSLEKLYMGGCTKLQKLPPIENGAFRKLQTLWINNCTSLFELPHGFTSQGAFQSLEKLCMHGCTELRKFPPIGDGAFGKLKTLLIGNCSSLLELPDGFTLSGAFQSLEELNMHGCMGLQKFPPIENGAFGKLKTLSIDNCSSLLELPNGFTSSQTFQSLEKLYVSHCENLQRLPPIEDGAFGKLQILWIDNCSSLLELPNGFTSSGAFGSLEELYMHGCWKLQKFPYIEDGAFGKLKTLWIAKCNNLLELPGGFTSSGAFQSLEELNMHGCTGLQKFPPIEDGAFGKLKTLWIGNCSSLLELPDGFTLRGAFQSLEELDMHGCTKLRRFPSIEDGAFGKLKTLRIDGCNSLLEVPSGLTLSGASISGDGAFGKLKTLWIANCNNLLELPGGFTSSGAFQSLEELNMHGCTGLQKFPPIEDGAFGKLKTLWIGNCSSLLELPDGFTLRGAFQSLEVLDMHGCTKLRRFPSIEDGAFGKLKTLRIDGCNSLLEVPSGLTLSGTSISGEIPH